MRIRSLQLSNFRSYDSFNLDDLGDLTLFIGRNGVGKTNILEAVSLLTSTQSFRHAQIAQLIKEGATSARVAATLGDGNRLLENEMLLEPGKKRYQSNGKPKKIQDVRGVLPAVAFTPDDLDLAKGSSSVKRDAFDNLGVQLSAHYYIVRRDYEKVLRYKNRLLKDEASDALIESINETLLTCGSQLFCFRTSLVGRLLPLIAQNYRRIAGSEDETPEVLSATYQPSWLYLEDQGEDTDAAPSEQANQANQVNQVLPQLSREEVRELMTEALKTHGAQELARKRSLVGPHNDKIEFMLDGRAVSTYASQGQQRTLVLAWKLAEVELVNSSLGIPPVLLLDDVMSELDSTRRDLLVRFVTDDIQTFITATDLSGFNDQLLDRADVHYLE